MKRRVPLETSVFKDFRKNIGTFIFKILAIVIKLFIILFVSCSRENIRLFNFTYEVSIESTNGKKIELWIPYPKSNEVQTISNINIDSDGLPYLIKDEEKHHNQYFYI